MVSQAQGNGGQRRSELREKLRDRLIVVDTYYRDYSYEDQRVGGFVTAQVTELMSVTLGGGYSESNSHFGRESDSAYGEMGLVFSF